MHDMITDGGPATGERTAGAGWPRALHAGWHEGLAIVNLRGDARVTPFRKEIDGALGLPLPVRAGTTSGDDTLRVVWVGPDDWFVIGPGGQAGALVQQLRMAAAGFRGAVTDVSGGYTVLCLSGVSARDVLAQGCPLDLHPRVFPVGATAGSHFFKATVWLWKVDNEPTYEVLVRRSFMNYVWLMVERTTLECGLAVRHVV